MIIKGIDDTFCPRHGRASRPVEVPGLRCDCRLTKSEPDPCRCESCRERAPGLVELRTWLGVPDGAVAVKLCRNCVGAWVWSWCQKGYVVEGKATP